MKVELIQTQLQFGPALIRISSVPTNLFPDRKHSALWSPAPFGIIYSASLCVQFSPFQILIFSRSLSELMHNAILSYALHIDCVVHAQFGGSKVNKCYLYIAGLHDVVIHIQCLWIKHFGITLPELDFRLT